MPTILPHPDPEWRFPESCNADAVARLGEALRLPEEACRVLAGRGLGTPDDARAYLRPHTGHLHDPWGLAGVDHAVERIAHAVRGGETILVHGDFDVDGMCSTAILVRALRMMGARAEPFVPDRIRDGYDLTTRGVEAASAAGATLVVTADCGIVAHAAVRAAAGRGIDVVVTDHHTPGDTLPSAAAVVNPNRPDCGYPHKGLAGAGVAFKLLQALAPELDFAPERLHAFLDLVAIATVADLAPLVDENRMLVRWGLRVLIDTPNAGLRALLRRAGLADAREIGAGQIGFVLAPRLNALGRVDDPMAAVRLLLTDDPSEAARLADRAELANARRREMDGHTLAEALEQLEATYDPDRHRAVVLRKEGWHPGVIGIVASRVAERIHRPTVMLAVENGEARGSARSIPGFDLHAAMTSCREHLTRFGGHRAAAGCSLPTERIDAFAAAFDAAARATLGEDEPRPTLRLDLELPLARADLGLARVLAHGHPFGIGNPTPLLAVRGVAVEGAKTVGRGHLALTLRDADASLEAIGFGMAERVPPEVLGGPVDAAFRLEERTWRGRTHAQAKLVALRPAA